MSPWPEIEWDDCYPTDRSIKKARRFFRANELDFKQAAAFLLRELPKCAENCCASCRVDDGTDDFGHSVKRIQFSTGGWSGAEELVGVIEERFDMRHYWVSWHRGGHYVFEVPPELIPT